MGRNIAVCVVLFLMFLFSLFLEFDENGRSFHICCWWCLLKLCIWLLLCERQKKGALESSCHVKPSQWTRKCFCWLAFRKFYKAFRQQQQQQKHSGSKKTSSNDDEQTHKSFHCTFVVLLPFLEVLSRKLFWRHFYVEKGLAKYWKIPLTHTTCISK